MFRALGFHGVGIWGFTKNWSSRLGVNRSSRVQQYLTNPFASKMPLTHTSRPPLGEESSESVTESAETDFRAQSPKFQATYGRMGLGLGFRLWWVHLRT